MFDLRSADQQLTAIIGVAADFDADPAAQRATEGWRTARRSRAVTRTQAGTHPQQEAEVVASAARRPRASRAADRVSDRLCEGEDSSIVEEAALHGEPDIGAGRR